jgi:iron(III) transport system permease protein
MTSTVAVKVFLLVPAFRSLDSSLEEAARTNGATPLGTVWRVVIPVMAPTIVVVMLIGMIRSMQAFEIELILGTPARIDVYSTIIFRAMIEQPPLYGIASSLSILFLMTIVPFVVLQQWYGYRHSHASVSGKYSNRLQDLGAWRWPLFSVLVLMLILMTIVPVIFLLMSTFMKLFGMFNMAHPWTTSHWITALGRGDIARSLWNTIRLGISSAITGMLVFTLIAYITVKTRFVGSRILDFMTWLPALIPGLVLSLGLLQMFAGAAVFRPFYGTIVVMILAIVIGTMTVGTQIIRGNLRQLSNELEEAAWVFGGSRLYTIRRIVLPLIAPSVAVIGLEIFATSASAVGIVALLGTGATQPLSLLQLTLLDSGKFEPAAVVGIVIMSLTISAALLARYISARSGLQDQAER